jgi:histidine triad (HIT) family protein
MADCLFCRIANKEIPSQIVYEDQQVVVFEDIHPQAPIHSLVISKSHFATLNEVRPGEEGLLGHMMLVATRVAKDKGLHKSGYRIVANCLEATGQSVFHIHLHLLGGRRFAWPPG